MRSMRVLAVLVLCCAGCGGTDDDPTGTEAPGTGVVATTQPVTAPPTVAATTAPATTAPATYTVQAGDSLFAIAERLCTDLDTLVATNAWADGIEHPIFPGDVVAVPAGSCAPAGATTAPTGTAPAVAQPDAPTFRFCEPGECGFPYGDPEDGVMVYAEGACTAIRDALRVVVAGPTAAADPSGPADEAQVRAEARTAWQNVIDAYGRMGDVPEGVTTALGRAGAIEGDLGVAYVRVVEFGRQPVDAQVESEWNALYGAMTSAMDATSRNREPIDADLDERCPPTGTSA